MPWRGCRGQCRHCTFLRSRCGCALLAQASARRRQFPRSRAFRIRVLTSAGELGILRARERRIRMNPSNAGLIAQLDRAPAYEAGCRKFESF
jgi:hypothetical protein